MNIRYSAEQSISADEFIDVLRRSTLAERRPIGDRACIEDMLRHANLLCTAWDAHTLIGVARCGLGRELIRLTQSRLGPRCKIILLAAPKAETYYPKIALTPHRSAWILDATKPI